MPASSTLKPNGERHDVALSKLMSKLLRHTAKEYGVPVTRDGWVVLELVVAHVNTRAAEAAAAEEPPRVLDREYTREQVCEMITLNDKQRFELRQREDGTEEVRATLGHSMLDAHSNSTAGRSLSRLPPPYRPPSHAVCNTAPTAPNARFQVVKGPSKRPQSARACQVVDTAAGLTTAGVSAHVKSVATARRVGGGQHADLRTSRTWLPFTSPLFIENDPDCLDDCDDFDYERAQMSRGWGEEFSAGRRTPTNQLPSNSSDASNSARGSESARSSSRRQPTAAQRPAANRATTARGSASQEDSHFEA